MGEGKPGDWIDWHGGECPVPRGTMVELWLRDEAQPQGLQRVATVIRWQHGLKDDSDIVRYRIVGTYDPRV